MDLKPLVSICTPTFNRRPFIPYMIKCFEQQTYPKDRIEWIIIDDGTDPILDLVTHIKQVKYTYYKEKMLLGTRIYQIHFFFSITENPSPLVMDFLDYRYTVLLL
jgi:hypothetical protein